MPRKKPDPVPCTDCGEPCVPNSAKSKGRCGRCGKRAANAAMTRFLGGKVGHYIPGSAAPRQRIR